MKKIAFIMFLMLATVFALTACSSTPTTYMSPRWSNEQYLFKISKAMTEDSTEIYQGTTFIKEPGVSGYEMNMENAEEIIPEDISGTYLMKISVNSDSTCTLETEQVLYVQYPATLVHGFALWDTPDANGNKLKDFEVSADSTENPFLTDGSHTVLKSTTKTSVVFRNDASQRPYSSENHVNGFYIGKSAQEISKYDLSTVYTWGDKNKVTITVNGEEQSVSGKYESKFIDANQILLFVRSMEKTKTSFQDKPVVAVYVPKTNHLAKASFVFTYNCNTVVLANGTQEYVNLNAVGVVVDGSALMLQLNVPETVNAGDKKLDYVPNLGSISDKYSILRFRSGLYKYQLASFDMLDNGADILEAIKVKPATENN